MIMMLYSINLKSVLGKVLQLITFATVCLCLIVCGAISIFPLVVRDQPVFIGTDTFQVSLVKHSNEANWDAVGSNTPIYLGARPKNCVFETKSELFFRLTGAQLAIWRCKP
jgi:hypothetical protein